ncbi:uncharacterized protein LOC115629378 [Scaptodrosophila lebanonensis]|uniref:Uncharacterized protein LOC115629378 n=1 Tax=Drosophila lebanonensis TaxID=7225 RepID=A0A6J2U2I2_DROLE|nr:uncharacterized protein LOC115629378 [Scaptodrosophila lebanonensis]
MYYLKPLRSTILVLAVLCILQSVMSAPGATESDNGAAGSFTCDPEKLAEYCNNILIPIPGLNNLCKLGKGPSAIAIEKALESVCKNSNKIGICSVCTSGTSVTTTTPKA